MLEDLLLQAAKASEDSRRYNPAIEASEALRSPDSALTTERYASSQAKVSDYGNDVPITEIEPLRQMVALQRSQIPYGIRGYCLPPTSPCFVHEGDPDTFRVHYHEDLHLRISRQAPNHPEWEVRMLEDWRLGEENSKQRYKAGFRL